MEDHLACTFKKQGNQLHVLSALDSLFLVIFSIPHSSFPKGLIYLYLFLESVHFPLKLK